MKNPIQIIEKTQWAYQVFRSADGKSLNYWNIQFTGVTYSGKKDAIKALHYYGRGFVEAKRHTKTQRLYGGTFYGSEYKKVYELV
ncbi:MAG: hypothetical protein LBI45_05285 [Bacteroidales bacterium]|jgi:hypothetical protein|nr:hypothetical protein [Bacteroidales bacterium]